MRESFLQDMGRVVYPQEEEQEAEILDKDIPLCRLSYAFFFFLRSHTFITEPAYCCRKKINRVKS